ncbi:MAG: arginase [Acidobacteriota bacterium]
MRKIRIIGVPMDLGADRRGVDMGPSALRIAGLNQRLREMGYQVQDFGNVLVALAEVKPFGKTKAKYLNEIAGTCHELAEAVRKAADEGIFPLVLGGDHSIAIGTIAGIASHHRKRNQKIGVIWLDAHGDFNTPDSSPTGNVHGMPLAVTTGVGPKALTGIEGFGRKVDPANIVILGARDLDVSERQLIRQAGVRVFTMRDLDEIGMKACIEQAIAAASNGTAGFHVSFDADAIDPVLAPGVGTPVRGGLSYREAHLAMEMMADSNRVLSCEFVEVNPILDQENKTAILGVELISSLLGKKIF